MSPALRPLLLASALALTACTTQLQHGLDERDANEIVSVLVARGYTARKVPEKGRKPTWAIELDERDASAALRVLTELKLPRAPRLKTQALAQHGGLIDTPAAERLRQLEAQEGDLEEALETMDGVASAAVELVVPSPPRPGQPAAPSKASVLMRVHPDATERLQRQRAELRALVAAGVEGLHADDVILVMDVVTLQASAPPAAPSASRRAATVALGVTVTLLVAVMAFLALRLRQRGAPPRSARHAPTPAPSPPAAAPVARPLINPAIQRKAA